MEIYVENLSAGTMPTVTVSVDAAYLLPFSTVNFTPSVDEVTAAAYRIHLTNVEPGQIRLVTIQLQAEHYWRQAGAIAVQAADGEPLVTQVSTFVFP